ncbi:MAG: group II intron reverse transcriptase/maturase [Pseudomonadota bacterium]
MSRHYNVTLDEVLNAWKSVRKAGGSCGYDGQTIQDFEKDLDNQIYKIWNRMSSGSYMAQPVLLVKIPKAKGGFRTLGVPTVSERIAQTVVKNRLETILEDSFHKDSFAYRPNKSAIDAVTVTRERCFRYQWLLEIDIKGFFDNLDHDILMGILQDYTDDKVILLYSKRFLKASGIDERGIEITRIKGTPQGGVASCIFSNLYLHEAFDKWISEKFPWITFARYADDIVVHCKTEKQAYLMKNQIEGRLKLYNLQLHPEKTKVVYTGTKKDMDKRGHELSRKFTFLGYDFKPRICQGKRLVFTPGISTGAIKKIRSHIKEQWRLKSRISEGLREIAKEVDTQIKGWIEYYGHHRRSDLYRLAYMIDNYLAGFIKKKSKVNNTWNKAWKRLQQIKAEYPKLLSHWHKISLSERRAV